MIREPLHGECSHLSENSWAIGGADIDAIPLDEPLVTSSFRFHEIFNTYLFLVAASVRHSTRGADSHCVEARQTASLSCIGNGLDLKINYIASIPLWDIRRRQISQMQLRFIARLEALAFSTQIQYTAFRLV